MEESRRALLEYFYQKLRHGIFPEMPFRVNPDLEKQQDLFERELMNLRHQDDGDLKDQVVFETLSFEESESCEGEEYDRFLQFFFQERILDFLYLDRALKGFTTLDHVLGVHHLALKIARHLRARGIPVDLGRVSGAAACHDIGKYGVKGDELPRIAHYHYYYSDLWYRRRDLEYMGNIAVNHSTWDLELNSLSIESMILIYCDFRVKNDPTGKMRFYTLEESFQVILNKLEEVDESKERRYQRVYHKLVDFEAYLAKFGIPTDPFDFELGEVEEEKLTLARAQEVLDNYKLEGIDESIFIMHLLRSRDSMRELFEIAMGDKDSSLLSLYLRSLEHYHRYITPLQKDTLLEFLYVLCMHGKKDIRQTSSRLLGKVLSHYDIVYRKERPPSAQEDSMKRKRRERIDEMLAFFSANPLNMTAEKQGWQEENALSTISALLEESLDLRPDVLRSGVFSQASGLSLKLIDLYLRRGWCKPEEVRDILDGLFASAERLDQPGIMGLARRYAPERYEGMQKLWQQQWRLRYEKDGLIDLESMYLNNLKTQTPELEKEYNLQYLMEHQASDFHLIVHLLNLMKVSSSLDIRRQAGLHLLTLQASMNKEQLNDIAIELLRSLELEVESLKQTLPPFLAEMISRLADEEIREILEDIDLRLKDRRTIKGEPLCALVAHLLALLMQRQEAEEDLEKQCIRILANGLVIRRGGLDQEVLSLIAEVIYQNEEISALRRYDFFRYTAKKFMVLSKSFERELPSRLRYALYINASYNLLSRVENQLGEISFPKSSEVVLYHGSFDPMLLRDKLRLSSMEEKNRENYILVEDLDWRKNLQPFRYRRDIALITTADLFSSFVMSEKVVLNPSLAADREKFASWFPDAKVRFVAAETDEGAMQILRLAMQKDWELGEILDVEADNYIDENHLYRLSEDRKLPILDHMIEHFLVDDTRIIFRLPKGDGVALSMEEKGSKLHLTLLSAPQAHYFHDPLQMVVNEALYIGHRRGLQYASVSKLDKKLVECLSPQGLIAQGDEFLFPLQKPVVHLLDLQSRLLSEYRGHEEIRNTITKVRAQVQHALKQIYPERGVLFLDRSTFFRPILRQIEEENRRQGENLLCVPLGTILQHHHLPKNPSKSMHIHKVLDPVHKQVFLRAQKNYQDLDTQIASIAALGKRVILIDDVLHTGIRLDDLIPRFRAQGIEVVRLFVGLITRSGYESAKAHHLDVSWSYFLEEIEDWYLESDLYPLFGGLISPEDDKREVFYSLSNNRIMPFIDSLSDSGDPQAFYRFSLCCIEAAREVVESIDRVFRKRHHRALKLMDLNQVFYEILIPDIYYMSSLENKKAGEVYGDLLSMMMRFKRLSR